jgi:mutator protein MutT
MFLEILGTPPKISRTVPFSHKKLFTFKSFCYIIKFIGGIIMSKIPREQFLSSIYLIIRNDEGKILLQRRQGTKLWCGFLALPAGHIDEGENTYEAAIREAKEELGITITQKDIIDTFVVCRRNANLQPYYDVYFEIDNYEGEISIKEPEKCSELVWFSLDEFPNDVIEFEKIALNLNEEGIKFSVIDAENK